MHSKLFTANTWSMRKKQLGCKGILILRSFTEASIYAIETKMIDFYDLLPCIRNSLALTKRISIQC